MSTAERCESCRFWNAYALGDALTDGLSDADIGDCRRRSPRISDELMRRSLPKPGDDQFNALATDLYIPSAFPVTAAESWCGEYEATAPAIGI